MLGWRTMQPAPAVSRTMLNNSVPGGIYLDYAATTPLRAEVLKEMLPYLTGAFGNASSLSSLGVEAKGALEKARAEVARSIGAEPDEIVFTSGGDRVR
jgi:cysteine desulfurase